MADKVKTAIRLNQVQLRLNKKSKQPSKYLSAGERAVCRVVLKIRENEFYLNKDSRSYHRKYGDNFQTNPLFVGSLDQECFLASLLSIMKLNDKLAKLEDKHGVDRDEVMKKNMELNTPVSSMPQL